MKLSFWHGYLLSDTGSNVFTRELTRALSRKGVDVTLFCQDPEAEQIVGDSATPIRPQLGGDLPVFVLDRYSDVTPRLVGDFSEAELEDYIASNATALASVSEADFILANHAVMGGPVAARAATETGMPFGVYVHGSELEYAIKGNDALTALAREALAEASIVFVGSRHTESRLKELVGEGSYGSRIELLPPGVDTAGFSPNRGSRDDLFALLEAGPAGGDRTPDPDAADKLRAIDRFVLYAGKLMVQKGVGVLLEAWSKIHADLPGLHLVIVGFGDDRAALELSATGLPVVFTGGFSHDQLQLLMPEAEAVVVPSVLSEAFGMIAAEAAACGVVPLVSDHSGLREVAEALGDASLTFDGSADDLAASLYGFLSRPMDERHALGELARERAVKNWGWEAVAARFLDLAGRR